LHSKGHACDVENFFKYKDVVKKIMERKPTKVITISINMKDVEKAAVRFM
jgi:ACT domain-containing protein